MSNPENAAASDNQNTSSFVSAVNEAVAKATVDDKGNLVLPEGLSEEVAFAATLEKRRRDTQSSYTKVTQEKKALEAQNTFLLKQAVEVPLQFTAAQQEELEDLKFSDPEAWRVKLNEYETEARTVRKNKLTEEVTKVDASTRDADELERRKQLLHEFTTEHPGVKINDDVIENDIPPRLKKELETGKITFEEFLSNCYDYLTKGKVIKQDDTLDQPNLSKVGGGSKPSDSAVAKDITTSYAKEVY